MLVAVVVVVLCDKVVGLGLGAALATPVVVVFVVVVFEADVSLAGAGLGAAGLVGLDLVVPRDALVFVAVVVSEVVFLAVREDLAVDFMSPLVRGFFSVDLGAGVGDGLGLGEVFATAGLGVVVVGDFAALKIMKIYNIQCVPQICLKEESKFLFANFITRNIILENAL